jgi:ferritin
MLPKKVEDIINVQIQKEGYSSNLYLAMAVWAEQKGYPGVADWLYEQADEEKMHMLKFVRYVNERGGRAIIPEFEKPPVDFGNIKEMFDKVLAHEQFITGSINEIVGITMDERDFTTHNWIQWFVTEQIEEEASVQTIIDKLNMVGENNLYMFDRDILGMRGEGGDE